MSRDKYVYVVVWVKYVLAKSSCVSKIPHGHVKNKKTPRITVSVFLRTCELTALLLSSFHLGIHYYNLGAELPGSGRTGVIGAAMAHFLPSEAVQDEKSPLTSRPWSALRRREVAECPEVADSVDTRTRPQKTAEIDNWARGKRSLPRARSPGTGEGGD